MVKANPSVLFTNISKCEHYNGKPSLFKSSPKPHGSNDIFIERPDDDLPGSSKNDEEFMRIVSTGIRTNDQGNIEKSNGSISSFK